MDWKTRIIGWADNDLYQPAPDDHSDEVDWRRVWPFAALHLSALFIFVVGVSPIALTVAIALYLIRMFAITAFFHRYFSHKTFKTSRALQFLFALIGTSATQRGPLWWAGHHRHHHKTADTEQDPHSPNHGFWQSHCGWFMGRRYFATPVHAIRDFACYPELRFLDRYDMLVPVALCLVLFLAGELMGHYFPTLDTSGAQLVVWGYVISTLALTHATLSINSLAHRVGSRRYATRDQSRNNWLLALITLGEGWHNNHHHYAGSARQGFFWWEVDISYLILKWMSWMGLVWDLKPVPERKRWAHQPHRFLAEPEGRA